MFYEVPGVNQAALAQALDGHDWPVVAAALAWVAGCGAAYTCQENGVAGFGSWLHADLAGLSAARLTAAGLDLDGMLWRITKEVRRAA